MQYQRKVQILGALVVILLLILIGTIVFNPDTRSVRQATGVLLESEQLEKIVKIDIQRPEQVPLNFVKRTGQWYALRDTKEYPVKNDRIEDLLGYFGKPAFLPQRASSVEAHERLGLGEDSASRITLWSEGTEQPVLDMYFGTMDATGKEIYFRFADSDVVKSVEDHFSSYLQSSPQSWYDLRLFPQSGSQGIQPELVQKISWSIDTQETFSLSRSGPSSWTGSGGDLDSKELDTQKIDTLLQDIISASGDDFSDSVPQDVTLTKATISLELGDGRTKRISILSDLVSHSHWATVTDTPYTYVLSEWQYNRLVKESSYFVKVEE